MNNESPNADPKPGNADPKPAFVRSVTFERACDKCGRIFKTSLPDVTTCGVCQQK